MVPLPRHASLAACQAIRHSSTQRGDKHGCHICADSHSHHPVRCEAIDRVDAIPDRFPRRRSSRPAGSRVQTDSRIPWQCDATIGLEHRTGRSRPLRSLPPLIRRRRLASKALRSSRPVQRSVRLQETSRARSIRYVDSSPRSRAWQSFLQCHRRHHRPSRVSAESGRAAPRKPSRPDPSSRSMEASVLS